MTALANPGRPVPSNGTLAAADLERLIHGPIAARRQGPPVAPANPSAPACPGSPPEYSALPQLPPNRAYPATNPANYGALLPPGGALGPPPAPPPMELSAAEADDPPPAYEDVMHITPGKYPVVVEYPAPSEEYPLEESTEVPSHPLELGYPGT